tara:strand:- start:5869 stop:6369 length:501 start_codon:yes stop_codon:yes gene_type:complete
MSKELMEILTEGNPHLYKTLPHLDFTNILVDLEKLCSTMYDTMIENKGMGLAANQVGIDQRVFIMDDSERFYFNPKILKESEEMCLDKEGCLSFPNIWVNVKRPKDITVEWQTITGQVKQNKFDDYWGKCFQHELDHLNGITFDKRVSKLKWKNALKKKDKDESKK